MSLFQITEAELLWQTDKAALIQLPLFDDEKSEEEVNKWWIPLSVIDSMDMEEYEYELKQMRKDDENDD